MHRPDHNIQDEILKILDAQRPPTARSESTRTVNFDDGSIEGDISYKDEPRVSLGQRFLERQSILNPNTPGFNKALSFGIDMIPQTPEQGIAELALAPIANPVVKGVGKGLSYLGRKGAPILKKGIEQGRNLLESMAKSPTADDIAESAWLRSNEEHLVPGSLDDVPAYTNEQLQEAFEQMAGENQMRFQPTQRRVPNVEAIREATRLTSREMEEIAAEEIVARRQLSNRDLSIRDDAGPVNTPNMFTRGQANATRQALVRDQPLSENPLQSISSDPAPIQALDDPNIANIWTRDVMEEGTRKTSSGTEIFTVQSRTGPTVEGAVKSKDLPKINLNRIEGSGGKRVIDHKNYRIVESSDIPSTNSRGEQVSFHSFQIGKGHSTDPEKILSGLGDKHSVLTFETFTKDGLTDIKNINFSGTAGAERQTGIMLWQMLDRFPGKWRINTANNTFTWDSLNLMLSGMMKKAKGVSLNVGGQVKSSRPSFNSGFSKKWNEARRKFRQNTEIANLSPAEYAQRKAFVEQEVVREVVEEFQKNFIKNSKGKLPEGPIAPWHTRIIPESGGTIEYGAFTIQNFKAQLAAFMGIPLSQMSGFLEDLYEE